MMMVTLVPLILGGFGLHALPAAVFMGANAAAILMGTS